MSKSLALGWCTVQMTVRPPSASDFSSETHWKHDALSRPLQPSQSHTSTVGYHFMMHCQHHCNHITVTHLNSRISLHDALSTPLQPHHSHTPHQSDITTSQHSNTSRRREISFLPWECFKYTVCHSSSHSLSGHSAVHCSLMTTCYPHWCHLVVGSSGPQHSLTCQS